MAEADEVDGAGEPEPTGDDYARDMTLNEMEEYVRSRESTATHFAWIYPNQGGLTWCSVPTDEDAIRSLATGNSDVYRLLDGGGCTHIHP